MACIRKRRGKFVVDYRDAAGVRRWVTCRARSGADVRLRRPLAQSPHRTTPHVDPRVSLGDYAAHHWLPIVRAAAKPRTVETYQGVLERHLVPGLGTMRLSRLQRP